MFPLQLFFVEINERKFLIPIIFHINSRAYNNPWSGRGDGQANGNRIRCCTIHVWNILSWENERKEIPSELWGRFVSVSTLRNGKAEAHFPSENWVTPLWLVLQTDTHILVHWHYTHAQTDGTACPHVRLHLPTITSRNEHFKILFRDVSWSGI